MGRWWTAPARDGAFRSQSGAIMPAVLSKSCTSRLRDIVASGLVDMAANLRGPAQPRRPMADAQRRVSSSAASSGDGGPAAGGSNT